MSKTTHVSWLDELRESPQSDAWRQFVAIYSPYIDSYLSGLGVRPTDIGDIRQEAMRVVVEQLPRFEHNRRKGAFRAWLRLVVANRLRSTRRSNAREQRWVREPAYTELAEQLVDPSSDLSRKWDEEHDRHVVHCLLEVVSDKFRGKTMTTFRRVVLNQESPCDVAKDLGMTVNAVRIARARVLRALRELGEGLID